MWKKKHKKKGQSHNSSYKLYHVGEVAQPSVHTFSQFGKIDDLVRQGDENPQVYDQFTAPAIGAGVGQTENMVFVDGEHSMVSVICRMIPSPDWFIGVDGVDLCVDSSWVDQIALELEPLDAGIASGLSFTAPRWETSPPEPVRKHKPRLPDHPAAGFYYPELRELPAIATVEFIKIKEYSNKELNDLARKDLLYTLKQKNKQKGLPRKTVIPTDDVDDDFKEPVVQHKEITTKNYEDILKDLEEDPVGIPRSNAPENQVVVVTNPPSITTTEKEFERELKSMDDVVLAVAHGKKLGLHKHLPRHFRSRLHHAVNKIQRQSHNSSYKLYHVGEVAQPSVHTFSQFGKTDDLVRQGDENPQVYDQFTAPAIGAGVGQTENMVFVDGEHSMVSVICRMIPSPDWFIGVDGVDLCVDSSWVDQIALELEPLDAGIASGLSFTAPRWETSPPEPVTKHKPRLPDHPAAGFYYPDLRELPAIAKVEFTKIKEYSNKELNDLARKELLYMLKQKNKQKGLPGKTVISTDYADDDFKEPVVQHKKITTKNYEDRLKDLEEDPVGIPRSNAPENQVVVVTNPPTITTTEKEFERELKSMDDVVLAVAHGKKLGLHKHLPRHFRSRLHHAVNKIQPNDCLVSEWSDWSPCSVTCGSGEMFRHRSIVRQKKHGGRDCPTLTDRKQCGNINSCSHVDYSEW